MTHTSWPSFALRVRRLLVSSGVGCGEVVVHGVECEVAGCDCVEFGDEFTDLDQQLFHGWFGSVVAHALSYFGGAICCGDDVVLRLDILIILHLPATVNRYRHRC